MQGGFDCRYAGIPCSEKECHALDALLLHAHACLECGVEPAGQTVELYTCGGKSGPTRDSVSRV